MQVFPRVTHGTELCFLHNLRKGVWLRQNPWNEAHAQANAFFGNCRHRKLNLGNGRGY